MGWTAGVPDLHGLLRQIEDCPQPVVAAMHGTALGGGLELAMAAHYRVATADARLGQPEVNLGIIPGAEGTQRLPRLVGIDTAIQMCVSGRPIGAAEALKAGLIDRIADGDLVDVAFVSRRRRGGRHGAPEDTRSARQAAAPHAVPPPAAGRTGLARKTSRRIDAPLAVVDAIEAAATLPFEDGSRRERELFLQCVRSEQCKALIHLFFAERAAAKVPGVPSDTPAPPIHEAGRRSARARWAVASRWRCADAGIPVRLTDVSTRRRRAGHGRDPPQLWRIGLTRPAHRGRPPRTARTHHPSGRTGRPWHRGFSSSRRCSRTWR